MNSVLGAQLQWNVLEPSKAAHLSANEVHLWAIPLQLTSMQTEQGLQWLREHQQNRYSRRPSDIQKEVYLAGRYYLMRLLASYCGCAEKELTISYSRLNKPYLEPNPSKLAFNFTDSHSDVGSIGLYAFYLGDAIGVDIESRHRRSNFAAIARRKFSNRERAIVTEQSGKMADSEMDAEKFLALWTRKEAYGKATGQGVNYRMNQLDLASPDTHQLSFTGLRHNEQYQLHQILVGQNHIGCTVYAGEQALKLKAFSPDSAFVSYA